MKIRVVMGVALIIVAAITLCKINAVGPFGIIGTARGLSGAMLVAGVIGVLIAELYRNVPAAYSAHLSRMCCYGNLRTSVLPRCKITEKIVLFECN